MLTLLLRLAILNPVLTTVSALSYYLFQGQNFELTIFILSLFNILSNMGFKYLSGKMFSNNSLLLRPCNVNNNNKSCNCDIFSPINLKTNNENTNNNKMDDMIGMPSGHSQEVTATMTFLILWILNQQTTWRTYAVPPILLMWAIWVMYSRYYLKCHNPLQIIIGSVIGYVFGLITYYIYHYYLTDTNENNENTGNNGNTENVENNENNSMWVNIILWAVIPIIYIILIFALFYIE